VNTFWLTIAGLIIVAAVLLQFVYLPKLRKTPKEALSGLASILASENGGLLVLGLAVPSFVIAMFLAMDASKTSPIPETPQQSVKKAPELAPEHVEMIQALAKRLEQNPEDGKGWAMLARSYAIMGRYQESLPAYEKAATLIDDPVMLVDYADVLAAVNDRKLQGKSVELLQRALKIDPTNIKAMNLMGMASFQSGDYGHAIAYWEKVLPMIPPDSPNAAKVQNFIAKARQSQLTQ